MKILAVGAHPDDVEFYCAGTVAKYKRLGHAVAIAVTTNGEAGSMTQTKQETARIRRRESEAAAKILDAEFYWMDFPDGLLFNGLETRLKFMDTIRQARPDLIIAHNPQSDYHPDHVTSGQVVWDCRVLLTVPNIKTEHPACAVIPDLVYMDTAGGVNFIPDKFVDITHDLETKRRMLACHQSQEQWVRQQYDMPFADFMESFAANRGLQAGCRFAEAFRLPPVWPKNAKAESLID
jgi:LmbE family N-acetylglucosaminyl deacetylase